MCLLRLKFRWIKTRYTITISSVIITRNFFQAMFTLATFSLCNSFNNISYKTKYLIINPHNNLLHKIVILSFICFWIISSVTQIRTAAIAFDFQIPALKCCYGYIMTSTISTYNIKRDFSFFFASSFVIHIVAS